jgi:hypothetical protein
VIYCDGGRYLSDYDCPTLFKYDIDARGNVSSRKVLCSYPEQNSCSEEVMRSVIKDVATYCPAQSYGLICGSHATGWLPVNTTRSFGDDSGSKIDIPTLASALTGSGVHFSYILMDACMMSQVEVAYELRNTADYMILSPAEVMSTGFPYVNIIRDLLAAGDTETHAINMAKDFIDYYKGSWGTIAVIKSSEMEALATATRNMISQYQERMSTVFTASKLSTMQSLYGYTKINSYKNSTYDYIAFAKELTDGNIPTYVTTALNNAVVYADYVDEYYYMGSKYSFGNIDADCYSGIGCYIPHPSYSNWNTYYQTLSWTQAIGQ